jgi:hypothetical protein
VLPLREAVAGMSTIPLPWDAPPLTKNDTRRHGNHHAMRRKWDAALGEARWAIRGADCVLIEQAVVILHWRQPDRRRRDGDGAALTLSACLDALVLEEVIPDDSWQHVRHSGITTHDPIKGQPGVMWLSVSPIPGEEA